MSMEETDAMQFYEEVVGDDNSKSTQKQKFVLEASNGRELTVLLKPADRKYVIDKLNQLPDEMLEMFEKVDDVEDVEDLEEEADVGTVLGGLSGDAIQAFEDLCAEGMSHHKLTQHHFEQMVNELDLEVLFEMGSVIIEMSLEDDGRITGFRKQD